MSSTASIGSSICPRCGGYHQLAQCPQVKAIEYQDGSTLIKRVEFFELAGARPSRDIILNSTWPSLEEGRALLGDEEE